MLSKIQHSLVKRALFLVSAFIVHALTSSGALAAEAKTASHGTATQTTPADLNYQKRGYANCVVTQERRAFVQEKEICVLQIDCETPEKSSVATSAVCKPFARNNRCPEARDCLTDNSVSEADYTKKTAEYMARPSNDVCFQPSAEVNRVAALLKTREGKEMLAAGSQTLTEPTRAPASNKK